MQIQIRGITLDQCESAAPLYVLDGVIIDNDTCRNGGNNAIVAEAAAGKVSRRANRISV